MSLLSEYRALEAELFHQQERLEALKNEPAFRKDLEFIAKLRELLAEYGKGLRDVLLILEPGKADGAVRGGGPKRSRRTRQTKVYRNPLTGERVESKGGNNKRLGDWKAQFGHDEVESWVQR